MVVFLAALGLAFLTHGTGVVRGDPERSISIPTELTMPLQVMAAHNDSRMFIRYRWPADKPGIHHDVLRYENGQWVRYGRDVPGSEPLGLHEDRVAMMLDDGGVPEFARYGGYITIGDGLVGLSNEADGADVEAHPYLGGVRGQKRSRSIAGRRAAALATGPRPKRRQRKTRFVVPAISSICGIGARSDPIP